MLKICPVRLTSTFANSRKSSRLINGFGKMGSEDLIAQTEAQQDEEQKNGELYETNLAIYGRWDQPRLERPYAHSILGQKPPPPPPPPSEFGPPKQFLTQTHSRWVKVRRSTRRGLPTITSNGVTNFGKIYRTTPLDGTRSLWFLRSTRPFDTASGFNTPDRSLFDLNFIATFKFQISQLLSNPRFLFPRVVITRTRLDRSRWNFQWPAWRQPDLCGSGFGSAGDAKWFDHSR